MPVQRSEPDRGSASAELAADVVFGIVLLRVFEDLLGLAVSIR
jgi:hypothetical protein